MEETRPSGRRKRLLGTALAVLAALLLRGVLAELAMVAGYFAFESVMYGTAAAWAAVGPNCIQGIAGVVLGMVCHALYPRLKRLVK